MARHNKVEDMDTRRTLGCFSHHKCASTWLEDIFRPICSELGLRFATVYSSVDFNNDLAGYLARTSTDFICYSNADYKHLAGVRSLAGFHVVRDPRDIIVSAYFSHLKTHPTDAWPELVEYRRLLQSVSKHDGIMLEIDFRREQFREMRTWVGCSDDRLLEVRMEDLTAQPYQVVIDLTRHLGLLDEEHLGAVGRGRYLLSKVTGRIRRRAGIPLPTLLKRLPAERVLGIVWENDFAKKADGRKKGEENTGSHYRKGVHGDWKNHLEGDHVRKIKNELNDLIMHYGYEVDDNW